MTKMIFQYIPQNKIIVDKIADNYIRTYYTYINPGEFFLRGGSYSGNYGISLLNSEFRYIMNFNLLIISSFAAIKYNELKGYNN